MGEEHTKDTEKVSEEARKRARKKTERLKVYKEIKTDKLPTERFLLPSFIESERTLNDKDKCIDEAIGFYEALFDCELRPQLSRLFESDPFIYTERRWLVDKFKSLALLLVFRTFYYKPESVSIDCIRSDFDNSMKDANINWMELSLIPAPLGSERQVTQTREDLENIVTYRLAPHPNVDNQKNYKSVVDTRIEDEFPLDNSYCSFRYAVKEIIPFLISKVCMNSSQKRKTTLTDEEKIIFEMVSNLEAESWFDFDFKGSKQYINEILIPEEADEDSGIQLYLAVVEHKWYLREDLFLVMKSYWKPDTIIPEEIRSDFGNIINNIPYCVNLSLAEGKELDLEDEQPLYWNMNDLLMFQLTGRDESESNERFYEVCVETQLCVLPEDIAVKDSTLSDACKHFSYLVSEYFKGSYPKKEK